MRLVPGGDALKMPPPYEHEFRWDLRSLRYHDLTTGRFVSNRSVLSLLEKRITHSKDVIRSVTQQFVDGTVDLADWQRVMAEQVKMLHTHSAALGKGGWEQMTQADWGRVGGNLRFQYGKLEDFARDIKSGAKRLTPGQIQYRAQMYGDSGWAPYWRGQSAAAQEGAFVEERRVLDPTAEHCEDCVALAARGWQPLGTLPEPGEASRCLVNCRCRKEYRREEER